MVPRTPLRSKKEGGKGDGVTYLVGEVPWISNREVIDARSHARGCGGVKMGVSALFHHQKRSVWTWVSFGLEPVQPP